MTINTIPPIDTTIASIFPKGVLKHERWGILVNGLDQQSTPSGDIFGSVVNPGEQGRVFHMVDCNGERVKLGVYQGLPGEESPCYALILERASLGSRESNSMVDAYAKKIQDGLLVELPNSITPTLENANTFIQQLSAKNEHALSM